MHSARGKELPKNRGTENVPRGTLFHEDVASVLAKFEQPMNASERKEHGALGQHFAYVPDGGTKAYEGKEDHVTSE